MSILEEKSGQASIDWRALEAQLSEGGGGFDDGDWGDDDWEDDDDDDYVDRRPHAAIGFFAGFYIGTLAGVQIETTNDKQAENNYLAQRAVITTPASQAAIYKEVRTKAISPGIEALDVLAPALVLAAVGSVLGYRGRKLFKRN